MKERARVVSEMYSCTEGYQQYLRDKKLKVAEELRVTRAELAEYLR